MKKTQLALKSLMIVSAFLFSTGLKAQDEVGGFFKGGKEDAGKLVNAYMRPLITGIGVGMNSGWTNTAKTKKTLRFDLRFTGSLVTVPTSDRTFNVNALGLQNMRPASGQSGISPTFSGDEIAGTKMEFLNNGTPTGQTFDLPEGTGVHYAPGVQTQLTVGLPKNIDVTLRYFPETDFGDFGKIGIFGVGAKVELLPLFMGKTKKLVPVDLALSAGYTKTSYNLPLAVNTSKANSNQELDVDLNGFTIDAILSKKLLFFTPFVSVGYESSSSNLRALGTYQFDVPVTPGTPTGKETFTDPITIKQNDVSGMKAAIGFQLNLAFFRFYASYTAAKYSYANAGIGFGIGK